jgi:hypothetical protein
MPGHQRIPHLCFSHPGSFLPLLDSFVLLLSKACVQKLLENAYIRRFVSGKARTRVKFKEDLVVEYEDKSQNALPPRHDVPSRHLYQPMNIVVESLIDSFTLSISSSSLSSPRASSTASSPRNSFASSPRDSLRSIGGRDITSHIPILREAPKHRRTTVRIE